MEKMMRGRWIQIKAMDLLGDYAEGEMGVDLGNICQEH